MGLLTKFKVFFAIQPFAKPQTDGFLWITQKFVKLVFRKRIGRIGNGADEIFRKRFKILIRIDFKPIQIRQLRILYETELNCS